MYDVWNSRYSQIINKSIPLSSAVVVEKAEGILFKL